MDANPILWDYSFIIFIGIIKPLPTASRLSPSPPIAPREPRKRAKHPSPWIIQHGISGVREGAHPKRRVTSPVRHYDMRHPPPSLPKPPAKPLNAGVNYTVKSGTYTRGTHKCLAIYAVLAMLWRPHCGDRSTSV